MPKCRLFFYIFHENRKERPLSLKLIVLNNYILCSIFSTSVWLESDSVFLVFSLLIATVPNCGPFLGC